MYTLCHYWVTTCHGYREWYHPSALVLVESFVQRLLTVLYDLSDVTFELPQEGLELDETWPAFVL